MSYKTKEEKVGEEREWRRRGEEEEERGMMDKSEIEG